MPEKDGGWSVAVVPEAWPPLVACPEAEVHMTPVRMQRRSVKKMIERKMGFGFRGFIMVPPWSCSMDW